MEIKNLLILLRNELPLLKRNNSIDGLCFLTFCLYFLKKINYNEYYELYNYIGNNKPKFGSIHYGYFHHLTHPLSEFYWRKGAVMPRKRWLNAQIRKFK